MQRHETWPALTGMLLLTFSLGCSDGADLASVGRVTPQALHAALAAGSAVVVDVRSAESFANGHIAAAIHIPADDIGARRSELPADKQIVTYCS